MSLIRKWVGLYFSVFSGILLLSSLSVTQAGDITLYTPYTKIAVPPGESINYTVDVINNSTELQNVELSLKGLTRSWSYEIKAGGYKINQLSVLPGEKKSFDLKVDVPLKVNKGDYYFTVETGGLSDLPLAITVTEQGTFKTEFTTSQANMLGASNTLFSYKATLKNRTADTQLYALMADAPRGWIVTIKPNYKQSNSVEIAANGTADISIDIDPPDMSVAGTYKIPLRASTGSTSATLELEAVITGSYAMGLSTPTGLLSTSTIAGDSRRLELVVRNSGTADLDNIKLSASTPMDWSVVFEPDKIQKLEPGKAYSVFATIKAGKNALAGDYVTNIDASTPETSARVSFRVSVKTPMLYGWIGILIIAAVLGLVLYLFRRYGRR